MTVVLDSWAVLRYLEGAEPAASRVDAAIDAGEAVMSWMNLGEVAYVLRRSQGAEVADATVQDLRAVVRPEVAGSDRVLHAARIKADHPMAYADAFAAATAIGHGAPLLTGDPELLIEGSSWSWEDLRPQ